MNKTGYKIESVEKPGKMIDFKAPLALEIVAHISEATPALAGGDNITRNLRGGTYKSLYSKMDSTLNNI